MLDSRVSLSSVVLTVAAAVAAIHAAETPLVTTDPAGHVIKRADASGVLATPPVDEGPDAPASSCVPPAAQGSLVLRGYPDVGWTIDPCGVVVQGEAPGPRPPRPLTALRIHRMTTSLWYGSHHAPGGPVSLFGFADVYTMSDGTTWDSGAGSTYVKSAVLDHVEIDGSLVRYVLIPPADGIVYQQTDYDSGDHSSQGQLGTVGLLVIEATMGETEGVARGDLRIVSNDPTWYGEPRFHYFASIPGSTVPFHLTFHLQGGATFGPDLFDQEFDYTTSGDVDFAHPTTTPALTSLTIQGTSQIPSGRTAAYTATAAFEGGATRSVESEAAWTVSPSGLATISAGVLTAGTFPVDRQPLLITATYTSGGVTRVGTKTVLGRLLGDVPDPDAWPTFQANPRHTGYIPLQVDPEDFAFRWAKSIAPGVALNPVAAAEGRVFVSALVYFNDIPQLFALDARDGEVLWSKSFGSVFSVNPPAWAYGNVYVQTGNHTPGTFLHAYDAATGDLVFESPHAAQWERYYAPTVVDGTAYVNGGYYGGMYAFDAFSGVQRWFQNLPQYDQWTPGIFEGRAVAYTSGQVQVLDRATGAPAFTINDPHYDWNGYAMNLAPVMLADGDVLAIHDGRLIRFDVATRTIGWELESLYAGQPSVAGGAIYAIDGGRLKVLDETTGALRWSWPSGSPVGLQGPMIVTDSHVLASSASTTYAIALSSHDAAWSYPAGGALALANDTLYIASANGTLTAIATPGVTQTPPVSMTIEGPSTVPESSSRGYRAYVAYADGRVRERTFSAHWGVAPSTYASIGSDGLLTTTEMFELAQDVVVGVTYEENGVAVNAVKPVHLVIGVTVPEFFERHRTLATSLHGQALDLLNEALARERALIRAIDASRDSPQPPSEEARPLTEAAMDSDRAALLWLQKALDALVAAESTPPSQTPPPETPSVVPKKKRSPGSAPAPEVQISP